MMNKRLSDTRRNVFAFVSDVANNIVYRLDMRCDVRFVNNFLLGNGITSSWFDRTDRVRIGISDFQDNPDEQVDSYDFMKLFVSTLHELTHVYQKEQLLHDDSNSAKYLALGEFAASCSQKYYEDNYKLMPHEIAAQYSAIKNGYEILSKFVGEEQANDMMCDYVNQHIEDEFIAKPDKPYSDIDDILDAYDDAFTSSRTAKRKLDVQEYKQEIEQQGISDKEADPLARIIMHNNYRYLEMIDSCKSGIEQDFLVSNLFLNQYDQMHRQRDRLAALSGINFEKDLFTSKKNPRKIKPVMLNDVTPDFSNLVESDDFTLNT